MPTWTDTQRANSSLSLTKLTIVHSIADKHHVDDVIYRTLFAQNETYCTEDKLSNGSTQIRLAPSDVIWRSIRLTSAHTPKQAAQ